MNKNIENMSKDIYKYKNYIISIFFTIICFLLLWIIKIYKYDKFIHIKYDDIQFILFTCLIIIIDIFAGYIISEHTHKYTVLIYI